MLNNLPIPTTLSTSHHNIYTDFPPTVFQGSPIYYCDEILLAVKACNEYADFQFYQHKLKNNRCQIYANSALNKFNQQKKLSYKYLKEFTLASIEFDLSYLKKSQHPDSPLI